MDGSILKRHVGFSVAACCLVALSPLATANADSYAVSYPATIPANPAAAVVSQGALLVNLLPQEPTRVLPQEPFRILPPVPTRVVPGVVGLWG